MMVVKIIRRVGRWGVDPEINNITDFNMDFFSLKGKVAIITGGNSGLGQGFALALAKAGANIFAVSIADDNDETKNMIEAEGVRYHLMITDVTRRC